MVFGCLRICMSRSGSTVLPFINVINLAVCSCVPNQHRSVILHQLSPQPTFLIVCFHYSIKKKKHKIQYELLYVAMKAQLENIQTVEAQTWWMMRKCALYLKAVICDEYEDAPVGKKEAVRQNLLSSLSYVISSLTRSCITFGGNRIDHAISDYTSIHGGRVSSTVLLNRSVIIYLCLHSSAVAVIDAPLSSWFCCTDKQVGAGLSPRLVGPQQ